MIKVAGACTMCNLVNRVALALQRAAARGGLPDAATFFASYHYAHANGERLSFILIFVFSTKAFV